LRKNLFLWAFCHSAGTLARHYVICLRIIRTHG